MSKLLYDAARLQPMGVPARGENVPPKNLPLSIFVCMVLFFASSALLYSQSPVTPNLSGTWQLSPSKSKLPKSAKIQSETIAITSSGSDIAMRHVIDGKESSESFVADGKEKTVKKVQGGEVVNKAQWKGAVLITETITRLNMPDQPRADRYEIYHDKTRWQLSADGQLLTIESNDPKQSRVYDKLPR